MSSEDTSKKELRAYVVISHATVVAANENGTILIDHSQGQPQNVPIAAGRHAAIQLKVINVGKTPAQNMRIYGKAEIVTWPISDKSLSDLALSDKNISSSIVGSSHHITKYEIVENLTEGDISDMRNMTKCLVTHGQIQYTDVFGDRHTTKYRYFTGGPTGIRGTSMSAHQEGNEAT